MEISIITNNLAKRGYKEEHSLSILIDIGKEYILFDTGQGTEFIFNSDKLNIDISRIKYLVLSHGHNDHCGNIDYIVKNSPLINIYHHPSLFNKRYSIHSDRTPMVKYIGLNKSNMEAIKNCTVTETIIPTKIVDNIYVTGEIPRLSSENSGGPFFFDIYGKKVDIIRDDQTIWIETDKGLLIVTGCCHSGIINTVNYIKKISGKTKVYGIIGGLHLSKATESRVKMSIDFLNSLNMRFITPLHCTGEIIVNRLKLELNCKVNELKAGDSINI